MLIKADALERLVAAIFAAEGCSASESEAIARHLVSSNLAGHDSHGVIRVPRYVTTLREGRVIKDQKITIVSENAAMAMIDGGFGFGQSIGEQAVAFGLEKARKNGCAIVALRNSAHVGRVGGWAEIAAEAGFVSIHFVNVAGSMLVAPFGGVDRRMSTAPFCVGVPLPGEPPIILDFATSLVAEGKVLVASNGGKPLPPGALIDPDGALSTDPQTLYGPIEGPGPRNYRRGKGSIRAMGEHRDRALPSCARYSPARSPAAAAPVLASAKSRMACCRSIYRPSAFIPTTISRRKRGATSRFSRAHGPPVLRARC